MSKVIETLPEKIDLSDKINLLTKYWDNTHVPRKYFIEVINEFTGLNIIAIGGLINSLKRGVQNHKGPKNNSTRDLLEELYDSKSFTLESVKAHVKKKLETLKLKQNA